MIALGGPTLKPRRFAATSAAANSFNDSTGRAYTETVEGVREDEAELQFQ